MKFSEIRVLKNPKMTRIKITNELKILKITEYRELLKKISSLEKQVKELEEKVTRVF